MATVITPPGPGNVDEPMRKASTSRATCRPSDIAHTTSDCPRRQSKHQEHSCGWLIVLVASFAKIKDITNDRNISNLFTSATSVGL